MKCMLLSEDVVSQKYSIGEGDFCVGLVKNFHEQQDYNYSKSTKHTPVFNGNLSFGLFVLGLF